MILFLIVTTVVMMSPLWSTYSQLDHFLPVWNTTKFHAWMATINVTIFLKCVSTKSRSAFLSLAEMEDIWKIGKISLVQQNSSVVCPTVFLGTMCVMENGTVLEVKMRCTNLFAKSTAHVIICSNARIQPTRVFILETSVMVNQTVHWVMMNFFAP